MMKRTILVLAALVALGARPAAAQEPLRHELALQLLEAMRMPEQIQASLATVVATQTRLNPDIPGLQEALRDFLGRYLTWDALKEEYAEIYAGAFTEEELREMAAFYRTPTGQKLARSTPQLTRLGAELGERTLRAHAAELDEMIARRVGAGTAPP
ncbi:MAG TPA: DUF2059 domain-containing protein [Longimicrobium sp.]|jgi:hypothetical protein|nr:DUF2059 domain-containing protein [Longimicrobium sp.]